MFSGGEAQRPGPWLTAGEQHCWAGTVCLHVLQCSRMFQASFLVPHQRQEKGDVCGGGGVKSRQRSEAEQVRVPCGEPSGSRTRCPGPGLPRAPVEGAPPEAHQGLGLPLLGLQQVMETCAACGAVFFGAMGTCSPHGHGDPYNSCASPCEWPGRGPGHLASEPHFLCCALLILLLCFCSSSVFLVFYHGYFLVKWPQSG